MVDPFFVTPFHFLTDWFQGSGNTPCEAAHGRSVWDVLEQNHEFGKTFNDAMANDSHLLMNVIVNEGEGVFKNLKSLVDVEVGQEPQLKPLSNGDMFKSIPLADAVLMKFIFHDWSDGDCVKILKRCKEAIPSREEGGKVIIIDAVIEEDNTKQEHDSITETQLLLDMMMMALVGGKERSEKEWEKLFLEAGFCGYKITPVTGFRL
ncbi:hypothetical protein C5167_039531 [Papaver somniferum]|uniref:O-methyltransferase C-terminal domain-containing protein n=1 Tax=Papaver somniferum TaxID=3469 RepID=A0A4Y7ICD8_PAPSO|nr:hypothetical protein C5167_039531 [Papaver somniferum]